MFQVRNFIGQNNHDLWAVEVLGSGEPTAPLFTFYDLVYSNLQVLRICRGVQKVLSLVHQVFGDFEN